MVCYKDRSYCVSPDCKNDCKRQLTEEIRQGARDMNMPLSVGYFCGLPDFMKMQEEEQDDNNELDKFEDA